MCLFDRVREWAASARGDEEKAFLAKAQRLYAQALRETKEQTSGERQNRIGRTADGSLFVEVDRDILDGVPQEQWVKTVKENLRERFPNGIVVNGQRIKINSKTRNEITKSKYTNDLRNNDNAVYADKMRATDNANEIVEATQNWVGEEPKHERKDTIREFARGQVLLRVGNSDYLADVDVGTATDGSALLYDIVNLRKVGIKEKNPTRTGQMPSSQELDSDRYDVAVMPRRNETRHRTTASAFGNSIQQTDENNNPLSKDVTEMSQSGRQWSIADEETAEESTETEEMTNTEHITYDGDTIRVMDKPSKEELGQLYRYVAQHGGDIDLIMGERAEVDGETVERITEAYLAMGPAATADDVLRS